MTARAVGAVAAGLIVVGVLWMRPGWVGLSGRESAAVVRPAEVVPFGADAIVWTDALGPMLADVGAAAARFRGAEGVIDAARTLLRVPTLDEAGLRAVGLVPESGLVAFRWRGAWWLITGVAGTQGAVHVLDLARRRGFAVEAVAAGEQGEEAWRIGARGERSRTVGRAIRASGRLIAMWWGDAPPVPAPAAATPTRPDFAEWRVAPRADAAGFSSGPGRLHAAWTPGADDPVRAAVSDALGPANLLFGRLVAGIRRIRADAQADAGGISVALDLKTEAGKGADMRRYYTDFLPARTPQLDVGALVPDEVMALLRLRINPLLIEMVPGFLRDRLVPARALGALHPALRGLDARALLLDQFDGQIVLGGLGLDEDAAPDPRTWIRRGLRRTVSGFVAVSLRSDAAVATLTRRVHGALSEAGVRLVPITLSGYVGWQVIGGPAPWTLLSRGRAVVWLSGEGELKRWQRVERGRFPALGEQVAAGLERDIVRGARYVAGALVTSGRLVRTMRRRGIPDHLTAMVAGVSAVAAGVELHDDGVRLVVSARPAAEATR